MRRGQNLPFGTRLIAVLAVPAAGAILLASCSSSPASTSSALGGHPGGGLAGLSCQAVISHQVNTLAAAAAAGNPLVLRQLAVQPGVPISPATGASGPSVLGQTIGHAELSGVAPICGLVTTSYTARTLVFFAALGSLGTQPGSGQQGSGAENPLLQKLAHSTAAERAAMVDSILHGQAGAPRLQVASVQVQILTSTPNEVTMNVTTNYTEPGGSGNQSEKVTAWKIGGRWFATSFQ